MIPNEPVLNGEDLYTVNAGGYSATTDAFARDPDTEGLWFLSMVGPQTALKAIWASLLKQPPDAAYIIRGIEGMALSGGYQRCQVPYNTVGTWTTRIARLPASQGWHALVYTRLAEFSFERDDFLLLAQDQADAPGLHHRFLDRRSPLPCTAPGGTGSGDGGWTPARSSPWSPPGCWPTPATPTARS